jgi:DNA replication protein DnaC
VEVLGTEADDRWQRYLKTRLQLAHLPYVKTFEQFGFSFQPSIDDRQIREFRTLRFVHEASNVVQLAPKILVIDQTGYLPLDELGATILFQLVSARYDWGSIILTSNKS